MKQKTSFVIVSALLLSGCGAGLYESVSVRTSSVSCTERLLFDTSTQARATLRSSAGSNSGSLDLKAPRLGASDKEPEQRCNEILELAKKNAEMENERIAVKLKLERAQAEHELMMLKDQAMPAEWD